MRAGALSRASLALAAVSAIGFAASGCNTSAFSKRELIVHFADGTSQSQQLADRAACLHATTAATPEPLPTSDRYASDIANQVRFRIDHADDKQISELERCFTGKPGVVGFDTPDLTG